MKTQCTIETEASTSATRPVFSVTENTMRRILAQPKPADILALYAFLNYTAHRQGTQTVKALECFIARGLQWSEAKVRRVKRKLRELRLIETITRRDKITGHVTGHFLRVSFSMRSPAAQNTTGGEMSYKMLCEENLNAVEERSKEDTFCKGGVSFSNSTAVSSTAGKSFPAVWKPDSRSRENKLAVIRPPRHFPSEVEFDDFLANESGFIAVNFRSNLYQTLCLKKWHGWDSRLNKWTPIRDWKKYVLGLEDKIFDTIGTGRKPATVEKL